ncbi:MAG: hypothetical protein R2788_22805 [Saprospiraceae bacterium]
MLSNWQNVIDIKPYTIIIRITHGQTQLEPAHKVSDCGLAMVTIFNSIFAN